MSGKHVTVQQYNYYIQLRGTGMTQTKSALKAGLSERTGRRLEKRARSPSQKEARQWRTRKNPFATVWQSDIVPWLEKSYQLTARTVLDHLQEKYPGEYPDKLLRTLQRHIQKWRAVYGKEKEIIFYQDHPPGQRGLSDYTVLKEAQITIQGQPFDHLLYHFRLAFSGWRWVCVVKGGESFASLSKGLQDALWHLGGCPLEHRTDSLSAAFKNLSKQAQEDFTRKYAHLMAYYHMEATRNNRGASHENGSIEAAHGSLKKRIIQELQLRGSQDFESAQAYEAFLQKIVGQLNGRQNYLIKQERPHLQSLPQKRTLDFETLIVCVTRASTIQVRRVVYTVPSKLIGQKLTVRLYHDRLRCLLGSTFLFEYDRVYPSEKAFRYVANYRHVIHSLSRKPQAFANSVMRDALLPTEVYKAIWEALKLVCSLNKSCRLMVGLLKLAADSGEEYAIGEAAYESLKKGQLPCLGDLRNRYCKEIPSKTNRSPQLWPDIVCEVPSLECYDHFFQTYKQEETHV